MKKLTAVFLFITLLSGLQYYNILAIEKDRSIDRTLIDINSNISSEGKIVKTNDWHTRQSSLEQHKSLVFYTMIISFVLFLFVCLFLGLKKEKVNS